jgi:5-methylcytosine-specific restriction endonuclease McrA
MSKKIKIPNCGDCDVLLDKQKTMPLKNRDGKYRCESCQSVRWQQLKKIATANHRKTERFRKTKRLASKRYRDKYLQACRFREYLVKLKNRVLKYGEIKIRLSSGDKRRILEALNNLPKFCAACHSKNNLTVDHIYPLSKAPKTQLKEYAFGAWNLTTLCRSCNSKKSAKVKITCHT